MNSFVVDASVAAKWFADEPHSGQALRLLESGDRLYAPDFLLLEMDSLACKWMRRGLVSAKEAKEFRRVLRLQNIRYHPAASLAAPAFEIASATQRSFYDCLYLALAVALKAPMVTADKRLFRAISASPLAEHILWIGDLAA